MNKPQQIDWPGIRAAALVIGVRKAARQAAANLPPIEQHRFVLRVLQRSHRERWMDLKRQAVPARQGGQEKPQSSFVIDGAAALASELLELGNETKHNFALSSRNLSKQAVGAKLKDAGNLHRAVQAAAIIHGWGDGKRDGDEALVQVLSIGGSVHLGRDRESAGD